MADIEIPKGYIENSQEHLVPISKVKPVDLERDKLVRNLVARAEELNAALAAFRSELTGEVDGFIERVAADYGVSMAGEKGNVTLSSYDGRLRVQVAEPERIEFDERLQVARKIIGGCIRRWGRSAKQEIKALVAVAFKVDKRGQIEAKHILALRKLDIEDAEWAKAMEAVDDSIRIARGKRYFRFQRRDKDGGYKLISLSLSGV